MIWAFCLHKLLVVLVSKAGRLPLPDPEHLTQTELRKEYEINFRDLFCYLQLHTRVINS